jgi:hypothetical protein
VAEAWTTEEIEAVVAAYFEMLRLELAGLPFVKAEYNRRVRDVTGRGKGSVEYKFQNISAVLVNHGQVYVKGYLPAQNYQRALEAAVLEWLAGRDDLVEVVETSPVLNAQPPERIPPFSQVLVEPPDRARAARPVATFTPVRIDFVRRDAENRVLGMHGEEFVFELERRRLHDYARRPDLSKKVRWRSRDDGDGLGYDILSFERTGQERLIEVKTTGAGIYTRFALTQNELERSRQSAQAYHLYRVFEFGQSPKLYMLRGALDEVCELTPAVYRASVARGR